MTKNKLIEALIKDGFDVRIGEVASCVDTKEEKKRQYKSYVCGFHKPEGAISEFPYKCSIRRDVIPYTIKNLQPFKKYPMFVRPKTGMIISEEDGQYKDKDVFCFSFIRFYSELWTCDKFIKNHFEYDMMLYDIYPHITYKNYNGYHICEDHKEIVDNINKQGKDDGKK